MLYNLSWLLFGSVGVSYASEWGLFQEQMEKVSIMRDELEKSAKQEETQMQNLSQSLRSKNEQITNANAENEHLSSKLIALKTELSDNNALEQELAELAKTNQELQNQHSEQSEISNVLGSDIHALSEGYSAVAQESTHADDLNDDLNNEIPDLEEKLTQMKYAESDELERQIIDHNDEEHKEIILEAVQKMDQAKMNQQWQPSLDEYNRREQLPSFKAAKEYTEHVKDENNLPIGTNAMKLRIFEGILNKSGVKPVFFDSRHPSMNGLENELDNLSRFISIEKPGFVLSLKTDLDHQSQTAKLTAMQACIDANQPHRGLDDVRKKLAIAHGLGSDQWEKIKITSVFEGSLCYQYTVADLEPESCEGLEKNLKDQFEDFKSAKIHPLLYRPAFDIRDFDEEGDKYFDDNPESFEIGPSWDLKRTYTQPRGWQRYGLKVKGKFKPNDDWIHPFRERNIWWRAFHGTLQSYKHGVDSVDAIKQIQQDGFIESEEQTSDENQTPLPAGVYCATSPEAAYIAEESLVLKLKDQTPDGQTPIGESVEKTFEYVIQCAVRPSHDGVIELSKEWWLVKDPNDIRAYGILFKEVNTDTPGQDGSRNESG